MTSLTGESEPVQGLLGRRVAVGRGHQQAVGEQEVVAAVGAPQAQEPHGAAEEGLRHLHDGAQHPAAAPPHGHVQAARVHRRAALQRRAPHREALLAHVHYTCTDSRGRKTRNTSLWILSNRFWLYWGSIRDQGDYVDVVLLEP